MPLYEYICQACNHRFERIQKFSDPLLTECPSCGGPVHKLISSPAIQFKGSGWYINDYARAGQSTSASKATDGASAAPEKKAEPAASDTASKPATPPATDKA